MGPVDQGQTALEREIELYLNTIRPADVRSEEPFEFWIRRSEIMPKMHNVAIDVLSIPATSAPSERVFSRASYILDRKRHNLDDDKVELELMYKINQEYLND